jgi:hypothetical protein
MSYGEVPGGFGQDPAESLYSPAAEVGFSVSPEVRLWFWNCDPPLFRVPGLRIPLSFSTQERKEGNTREVLKLRSPSVLESQNPDTCPKIQKRI